ncbi:diphosphomevalonate decarboxylase [Enteractinococcus coprophilus]|uniref:diphosphomevalonate decarboxylase n=1 Tax=Enteractinococcus coprophilus TaxID=1027633 RepID=A0A543AMD0_9MICC|nr:diphosphomevalonate decarboxylase [Enteractinococcus coprophilus]TQL73754.1 diphosphomevalonate decarboxylase [Enteractinococcus coprophilus]
MASIARAHPNIALVKYWGKADDDLIIPVAGSMSMTLDKFATTTTVELTTGLDSFELNGTLADAKATQRTTVFLDLVRRLAADAGLETATASANVTSVNEGPTAAGMASSASGFAALAVAAADAYGLKLSTKDLSRLARRGSGSASRSLIDRFAVWHAGTSDETSFAEAIDAPEMAMVSVTVDAKAKKVSSREGMVATRDTSPYYQAWIDVTHKTLDEMIAACADDDFARVGQITETHAHRMHAVIQATEPPIRYLAPVSWQVFDEVAAMRDDGLEAYATADAGPNVVIICRPDDATAVAKRVAGFGAIETFAPGPGAHLLDAA